MAIRHSNDYRTLASISRINLLNELQTRGPLTVQELASATGLHHNTTREHLHRLIDAGFVGVEAIQNGRRGRPELRYRAARGSKDPALRSRRAAALRRTTMLRRLLPTNQHGESTATDKQLDSLDDHMTQCGFDAEVNPDRTRLTMFGCPFRELAAGNPQVCEVHFALVQDALVVEGGTLRATGLHSRPASQTCSVELQDTGARLS